ncbi:MAG: ABC transporter permease [Chitinophagales bacterium]|nr:ABC transporter permease [Chitinophagales bacterium]
MLKNYLKIAIRNLIRDKGFATINILGLSVGLTVSLLILLWVRSEIKTDQFHSDVNNIYRVLANIDNGEGGILTWSSTPYPLIALAKETYPEIESIGAYDQTNKRQFTVDNEQFLEDGIYANTGFFEVLSFPFLEGSPEAAKEILHGIAISERLANKFFGEEWKGQSVGKAVNINGEQDYQITGVFANPPLHSSLQFDFVLSLEALHKRNNNTYPWGNFDSRIVLKTKKGASPLDLQKKLSASITEQNEFMASNELVLQAYNRAYLHNRFENGKEAGGRITYVNIFTAAALFLLLIASVNFMNLATARASRRAKEVGIRKTIGAARSSIATQFMIEAGLITFTSLSLAIVFSKLATPYFEEVTGSTLSFDLNQSYVWLLLLGVGIGTTLLSGSYPAFFLSSFKIANVLKGRLTHGFAGSDLSRALIVVQFILSALLVVGALGIQQQMNYIKNKHLGLDKDHVLYFRTPPKARNTPDVFREELARIPGIERITYTTDNPLEVGSQTGDPQWEGMADDASLMFHILNADPHFLETMNIQLADGRNFSDNISSDTLAFLINETAATAMKLDDPIGKRMEFWGISGQIVGVVKNFHISSLYEVIDPLIIMCQPNNAEIAMLKINPAQTETILAQTETVFESFADGYPFRYDFLDERYFQMYKSEERTGHLARLFAIVALFVSCLGLLGLSAFTAQVRTKEIGIRKILGATVTNIIGMLSKDFLKLVGIALVIALPFSWYMLKQWLSNFAYKIEISWEIFAATATVAIVFALITVSFQSAKAALRNPTNALRQE